LRRVGGKNDFRKVRYRLLERRDGASRSSRRGENSRGKGKVKHELDLESKKKRKNVKTVCPPNQDAGSGRYQNKD